MEASVEQLRSTTSLLGTLAKAAGRDPKDIKIIARYNFTVTPQPLGEGRQFFSGTLDQIRATWPLSKQPALTNWSWTRRSPRTQRQKNRKVQREAIVR